ncbi:MarR family winged helix-turn-helix transcriptional regulator [Luteibacter sp. ME-Dv--P-043b]|uniref:MarR family winged helix-turn-helix transcriptional regulator n=1 Tax=Luteibacter sp. ME-Dv--P-043b TaxID=3040291 RepID=UPI0025526D8B|nr:MarR family winged helix-turn-helix transcriptional regulator [Luteibacter sp. ME-Dv--P-043b]
MTSLTSKQAAHILRVLLQHTRVALEANPQFTVANLAALLAVIEKPGATQPEVAQTLGGVDEAVLSRQLRYLRGKRQGVVQSPLLPVVNLQPLESDNRVNVVGLTPEGEEFAKELTAKLNRLLASALK